MRSYPTVKDTPSRMTRKRLRREIFYENKAEAARLRRARRDARLARKKNAAHN